MRDLNSVLGILQEECAEVIQIISKINRFGMYGYNPNRTDKTPNKYKLIQELGDVMAMIYILQKETEFEMTDEQIDKAMENKIRKLDFYLPHIEENNPNDKT